MSKKKRYKMEKKMCKVY